MKYLELHDTADGERVFGATTPYDWYVVKNCVNNGQLTTIKHQDESSGEVDISKLNFIHRFLQCTGAGHLIIGLRD